VGQSSFREQLLSLIGFVIQQNRPLLRRLLNEHAPDDARLLLAKKVIEHLELCGYGFDEERQIMTKRARGYGWK